MKVLDRDCNVDFVSCAARGARVEPSDRTGAGDDIGTFHDSRICRLRIHHEVNDDLVTQ